MARPYLPTFFGRGDDPFGSLFREVQKTFEDFSQRSPFARFSSDTLSPKIDIAEGKDAIDVTAECSRDPARGLHRICARPPRISSPLLQNLIFGTDRGWKECRKQLSAYSE